jgi:hypothetical protein
MLIFIGIFYFLFDKKRAQKLPEDPGARLESFARIATRAAEKRYSDNQGKRDMTIAHVVELYQEWDLPVPSKKTIELAIDAEASEE